MKPPTPQQVRERLQRLRARHELSQSQLGYLMGYGQPGISMILSGQRTPTPFAAFVIQLETVEGYSVANIKRILNQEDI